MNTTLPTPHERADRASRMALTGLLVVGLFVGYEWFMSGLTKLVRGGFPSGLADELRETSEGMTGWYKEFLDGTVIPNGTTFGVLIELAELAIGVALIVSALVLLVRWSQLRYRGATIVLATVAVASAGAIVMNVAFHLANASPHPWLVPGDGFDEGVDLDSLLPMIELVFVVIAVRLLLALRREHAVATHPPIPRRPGRATA